MKEYRIPLVWQEWGVVWVTADSAEEAVAIALGPNCPLPEGYYVDDSVMLDDGIDIEEFPA